MSCFFINSEEAQLLNQQIFETLYYGAMEASCELAERDGPYQTYEGSPVSKGIFQVCFLISFERVLTFIKVSCCGSVSWAFELMDPGLYLNS